MNKVTFGSARPFGVRDVLLRHQLVHRAVQCETYVGLAFLGEEPRPSLGNAAVFPVHAQKNGVLDGKVQCCAAIYWSFEILYDVALMLCCILLDEMIQKIQMSELPSFL